MKLNDIRPNVIMKFRKALGKYRNVELAPMIGCNESYVSRIRSGDQFVSIDKMIEIINKVKK